MVSGLLDPYADDPNEILEGSGIEVGGFRLALEPYQSLDEELVKRRLDTLLGTPSTLKTSFRDGTFVGEGSADSGWLRAARLRLGAISLVERYDFTGVSVLLTPEMTATIERIQQLEVFMLRGTTRIRPESVEAIARLSEQITLLLDQASENSRPLAIEIVGHTDRSGTEASNLRLSARRAVLVRDLLVENGIPAELLRTRGIGSEEYAGDAEDALSIERRRRVSLRVEVGEVQSQGGR